MNGLSRFRVAFSALAVAFTVAAIAFYVGAYLTNASPSSGAVQTAQGTHLYLATVPASEASDPHPTWVSYYNVSPTSTNWRHTTTFILPANTEVTVTIYNYDGQSGLRNPFLSHVVGTKGGTFQLDGRTVKSFDPAAPSHLFAIPQLGLFVPVYGVGGEAPNQCGQAPCGLKQAHTTTTFSFHTPAKGLYRWQCFVPCAAGYIDGIGGPMQRVGYMDGYIKVV
ncbi:MAG: hypothetical protein ACRDNS_26720 [Trebonia sp.]